MAPSPLLGWVGPPEAVRPAWVGATAPWAAGAARRRRGEGRTAAATPTTMSYPPAILCPFFVSLAHEGW